MCLEEVFPDALLKQYDLMPLAEALPAIHSPQDAEQLERARRRFVFQELFMLQLAVVGPPLAAASRLSRAAASRIAPISTPASSGCSRSSGRPASVQPSSEIAADMAHETPMNRLLQGDVGSGKTVVAVYAMLVCVAHGYQAALMAPTEILARQHAETLAELAGSQPRAISAARRRHDVRTSAKRPSPRSPPARSTSSSARTPSCRRTCDSRSSASSSSTSSTSSASASGPPCGKAKQSPHYLVMTATPIPRTLSMTLFGDLDVSTLREMPPGRQEVRTYLVGPAEQARWWHFVREKLASGRQAYVVAPLVDESENIAAASVAEAFERLTNGELAAFRVGIIHGRMSPAEKEEAMADFRSGRTQVLVSHQRGRSRRRRAQRLHHGHRLAGAVRPGPAAPAPRPRRPRQARRLLRRDGRR